MFDAITNGAGATGSWTDVALSGDLGFSSDVTMGGGFGGAGLGGDLGAFSGVLGGSESDQLRGLLAGGSGGGFSGILGSDESGGLEALLGGSKSPLGSAGGGGLGDLFGGSGGLGGLLGGGGGIGGLLGGAGIGGLLGGGGSPGGGLGGILGGGGIGGLIGGGGTPGSGDILNGVLNGAGIGGLGGSNGLLGNLPLGQMIDMHAVMELADEIAPYVGMFAGGVAGSMIMPGFGTMAGAQLGKTAFEEIANSDAGETFATLTSGQDKNAGPVAIEAHNREAILQAYVQSGMLDGVIAQLEALRGGADASSGLAAPAARPSPDQSLTASAPAPEKDEDGGGDWWKGIVGVVASVAGNYAAGPVGGQVASVAVNEGLKNV